MNEEHFEPIIGMEVHVELKTRSKMFCSCAADWFGKPPNTLTCPVCLGLPGALPVPNKTAIEWCIMIGRALGCAIADVSKFDRKNYFYPDLPKGYQISQYDQPVARGGVLKFKIQNPKSKIAEEKTVRIRRVHMEEDTGKLVHAKVDGKPATLVDFNRSGVPLVEIVTEPDIRSSEEAKAFLKALYKIIRYLDVSDADMEKGSMRLEPNISVRSLQHVKADSNILPAYKVEVKNINSFTFVKKAIDFEVKRHAALLSEGKVPAQETRGWDEDKGCTVSQRTKEEAHDYRYFPEPDIPPMRFTKAEVDRISTLIPELPEIKKSRYINTFGLSQYDADILAAEKSTATYFEEALGVIDEKHVDVTAKEVANWIINKKIDVVGTSPAGLVAAIGKKKTKVVLSDDALAPVVRETIESNPKVCDDYRSGKTGVIMFLVGQIMKKTNGAADAGKAREMLEKALKEKNQES